MGSGQTNVLIKQLIKQNFAKGLSKEAAERTAKKTVTELVSKNKMKAAQIIRASSGIKNKITKEVATEIVEAGAKKLPSKMMAQALGGGGGLGLYGGLQSSFGQKIQTGDIDALLVTKDAAINAGLGFVTAGSGSLFSKYLSTKLGVPITKTQKIAQTTAVKALETAQFGTATPVLEGRRPEWSDYAHAAGVIAGMNVAKRIPSTAIKLAGFDNPKLSMKSASLEMAEGVSAQKAGVEVTGKKINLKDNRLSEKITTLTEKQFTQRGYARKRAGKSKEVLKKSRRQEIFGRKKKLNISDKDFRRIVESETGKSIDPKKK